ncbi:DNA-(apurinic or apyrimidinic site) endonuclease 2 isoform X2 [Typha latifolia]|uniref:DNA-(apurinic or apyrimidinic site) endonuclease 2 isoform X2 n=1 Tax=Typha latifolia TaxID=4733 RepID=UPI003C306B70
MKIVTYNVNGLRQRVAQHGSLLRLLNALDADIICFQETKLSRQELSADVTMADGYEAFVSCTCTSKKGRRGYSGVATFCRVASAFASREVALPLAAEEGFTGLLEHSRNRETPNDFLLEMPMEVEDLEDITKEELVKVDSEGRCVITDHGHFVLFNIYGPRAEDDDKERIRFKILFFNILRKRWEHLLAQGKRVFVVGDLNIAPAAIDRCDAEPCFEKNQFRTWLRSLLRDSGGPFFDVFRSKHPERKEAYTCFSPRIGAEEFNYGSRIDHILLAGSCLHENYDLEGHSLLDCHVEECDIMTQFRRGNSGNIPKWKGGRSSKLEGSDHVPVYVVMCDIPDVPLHNTPSLAVRYIPEVRGWQQTIVSFLTKGQISEHQGLSSLSSVENIPNEGSDEYITSGTIATHLPNVNLKRKYLDPSVNRDASVIVNDTERTSLRLENEKVSLSCSKSSVNKKARCTTSSQLTIKSFFQKINTSLCVGLESVDTNASNFTVDTGKFSDELSNLTEPSNYQNVTESAENGHFSMRKDCTDPNVKDQDDVNGSLPLTVEKDNSAMLQWQWIQQKMKMSLPLCKGHGEPCVPRSVKKGPNIGRLFYVCARAQGPASNTEANCGYFQWASLKAKERCR